MSNAKQIADQFWNRFESNEMEALAELIDEHCHFKMPGLELSGRAAILGVLQAYRTAFPDLRHRELQHVAAGDAIAIELVVEGTHQGPMHTPQGTVPASGKRVTWESCDYIRLRGERIVSWHVYHDPLPFLTALGLLPAA